MNSHLRSPRAQVEENRTDNLIYLLVWRQLWLKLDIKKGSQATYLAGIPSALCYGVGGKVTFLPFCKSGLGAHETAGHARAFSTFLTLQQIYEDKRMLGFEGARKAGANIPTNTRLLIQEASLPMPPL